ncbi:SseB family protein [Brachybacterium sp. Marseille-Q7125]|uniref:SseB family protein n=1 Tax=Brachybacterium sp. Marseille-Q7125 TaxID=2932815 RepID=UPI001FF1C213
MTARRELPAHFQDKSPLTDTAGVPWKGRDYTTSPFPEDDGSCPPVLRTALEQLHEGQDPYRAGLVAALAASRVLVPIMAVGTEETISAHGLTSDNGADMAMVTIAAADGARVLPVFTSVTELSRWQGTARPVPVVTAQAAQAAVQEGCTALLVDAARPDEPGPVLLQRSALWALAQGRTWVPPHEDPEVAAELEQIAAQVPTVLSLTAQPGQSSEVTLVARLVEGLDRTGLQQAVQAISSALGDSPLIAERITSLKLSLSR